MDKNGMQSFLTGTQLCASLYDIFTDIHCEA